MTYLDSYLDRSPEAVFSCCYQRTLAFPSCLQCTCASSAALEGLDSLCRPSLSYEASTAPTLPNFLNILSFSHYICMNSRRIFLCQPKNAARSPMTQLLPADPVSRASKLRASELRLHAMQPAR